MAHEIQKVRIEDAGVDDLAAVLALNEASVPHMNSLPLETFEWFAQVAAYFRVARVDGSIAGFLIGLTAEAPYESMNFRWFQRRYEDFVYIDRIAVAETYRRLGVAARLYRDIVAFSASRAPILACEVNIRPRNEASLRFHEKFDFRPVGSQDTEGGAKTVLMLVKQLRNETNAE